MTRLPLDLYAEVETASGTRYRWDANQAPGSRLRNFSFRTKIGEGFSDANGQLARRIDQDYPDLNLVNTVTFVGADGATAYEGRLSAMPRELSDTHSIGVTLAGWMAHAKDRKFSEIYVDRSIERWRPASLQRKANQNVTFRVLDPSTPDGTAKGVRTSVLGPWSTTPGRPLAEAWYDSGGIPIGSLYYEWARNANTLNTDTNWTWAASLSTDDILTAADTTGNLRAAGPGTGTLTATDNLKKYALLQFFYANVASASNAEFAIDWTRPTVYGTHGLTLYAGEAGEPSGVYASDVLRDVASRWCPQLDTSGVEDTTYVIQHLAFTDRTFPYDAFLEINKYHLWHLGVWENKRLDFRPYDLTDYDWEIRTDDQGTTFSPQGPTTEDLFNGIAVTYTDILTGRVTTLTPDDDATLADTSTTNPWNQHGIPHWDEIALSTPSTQASAVALAQAALADRNTAKTPGTITVKGYIRDRAGNEQPAWKPRAGQTIAITNFPNDQPRLIVETDYDDENKTVRIAVDRPFQLLDAYLDRVGNALGARGLA